MKTFSINNFDSYIMVFKLGGLELTDQTAKIYGITSTARGKGSATTGSLTFKGTFDTFLGVCNQSKVDIYLRVNGVDKLFNVAQIKHPVSFDCGEITVELDTLPVRSTIGYTDGNGNDLPYSFGKPFVKAVNVSRRYAGTVLETWTTVTEAELIEIFNTYTRLSFLLARLSENPEQVNIYDQDLPLIPVTLGQKKVPRVTVSVAAPSGGTTTDTIDVDTSDGDYQTTNPNPTDTGTSHTWKTIITLNEYDDVDHLGTFLQQIYVIAERDGRQELYDKLADLLNWRGITEQVPLEDYYFSGTGEKLNSWGAGNLHHVPPITYGLLKPERFNTKYSEAMPVPGGYDVETGVGGYIYEPVSWYGRYPEKFLGMEYKNIRTGETKTLQQLLDAYTDIVDTLLEAPTQMRVDLPYVAEGTENAVIINGQRFSGVYSGGYLTNMSIASVPVKIKLSEHGAYNYQMADSHWLEGWYVKVTAKLPYRPAEPARDGAVYYAGLVGVVYTEDCPQEITWVSRVVKQRGNIITLEIVPYYACVDGTTNVQTLLRDATITNISLSLTKDMLEDKPLAIVETLPVFIGQIYHTGHASATTNTDYRRPYYVKMGLASQQSNYDGMWRKYYQDKAVDHSVRWYCERLDENILNANIGVKTGDRIEYDCSYKEVYIVDSRPNITVTGVVCKKGNSITAVPTSYFTIDYEYNYLDITCTAVIFYTPLEARNEEWVSNDLYVAVDTGVYAPVDMLSSLATEIDKTISAPNVAAKVANFTPNFAVYGQTDIMKVISDLSEQCKLGYYISGNTLKVVYLDEEPVPVHTLSLDNIEKYVINTTDVLDILNRARYKWNSLLDYGSITQYTLNGVDTLATDLDYNNYIFDSEEDSDAFSKWHFNNVSRNWLHLRATGFMDSVKLEPYDAVTVELHGHSILSVVEGVEYDHEDGGVTVSVLIPIDMTGSLAKPWFSPTDFIVEKPNTFYGYDCTKNIIGQPK